MIRNNIDIIILTVVLILDYFKYITINTYIVLLIILFFDLLDKKYIENYYPTSSNNSQVLYNLRSVFNEKKAQSFFCNSVVSLIGLLKGNTPKESNKNFLADIKTNCNRIKNNYNRSLSMNRTTTAVSEKTFISIFNDIINLVYSAPANEVALRVENQNSFYH